MPLTAIPRFSIRYSCVECGGVYWRRGAVLAFNPLRVGDHVMDVCPACKGPTWWRIDSIAELSPTAVSLPDA